MLQARLELHRLPTVRALGEAGIHVTAATITDFLMKIRTHTVEAAKAVDALLSRNVVREKLIIR